MSVTVDYQISEYRLANGMRLFVSPDHSTPVVAVNLWYNVGARNEGPGQTGFAHLFEHIMFQGSRNVASGEHLQAMQNVGGSVNATTSFDRTNYFETVPTGALDLALWLEADRMATLEVTQENLDNQRDVVKEEKSQRYDNVPYGDSIERLLRLTFPTGHSYAHTVIGSVEDIDAATLQTASCFFHTYYHPANCTLTIVGDIEPDEAFAKVETYFGHIEPGPVIARMDAPQLQPLVGIPRETATGVVPADALYFCWRLPAHGTSALDACEIALDILGGSQTSRLYRRLVHHDAIASSTSAGTMGLIEGTSLGLAYARALDGSDLNDVENIMIEELERLACDGPTEDELAMVRVQFERSWLSQLAAMDSRADLINQYATLHHDPDRVNRRIAEFCAIGMDQVRDAVSTWLRPEQRAVLHYRKEAVEQETT